MQAVMHTYIKLDTCNREPTNIVGPCKKWIHRRLIVCWWLASRSSE